MEGGYTPEQLVELDVIQTEYSWLNSDAIETLREEQRLGRIEAGKSAVEGVNLLASDDFESDIQRVKAAHSEFDSSSREMAELYVAGHINRDDNEELFDRAVEIIDRYSLSNVDTKSWHGGTRAAGYKDTENSGRRLAEADFTEFCQAALTESATQSEQLNEAQAELENTRSIYANLLAQRSKRSINVKRRSSDLEEAKNAYHKAYAQLAELMLESDEIEALTADEREQAIRYGSAVETLALINAEIEEKLNSGGDKTRRFLNFWARQGGKEGGMLRKLKGMAVKSGVLGGAGVVAGAAASVAIAPVAGTVAGGAAGLGAAMYIGRKLFASRINRSADSLTVAEAQGNLKLSELNQLIVDSDEAVELEQITDYMDGKMRESIARNRTRDAVGLMLGAAAGQLIGDLVDGRFQKQVTQPEGSSPSSPGEAPSVTPPDEQDVIGTPVPAPEDVPDVLSDIEYIPHTVQKGEGITHVIQDLARDNGVELTPQELFDIYNENKAEFASLDHVAPMNVTGDYGIATPGVQLDIPPELLAELHEDILKKAA